MDDSVKQSGQAGTFFGIRNRCYIAAIQTRGSRVKRVNLIEYFHLAEALASVKRATSQGTNVGGNIWLAAYSLPGNLRAFVEDDNGFSTSKHVASELAKSIDDWIAQHLVDDNSPGLSTERFDEEFQGWQYTSISTKVDAFKSVFEAECHDVDVYSVGQISIYKTSTLVSRGSDVIPAEFRAELPTDALTEFNSAGKCLAFDLPTACGFHSLRGLELVMDGYLASFGVVTAKMKSWNDYIRAADALITDENAPDKPSAKVAAMLDRMRELDRNPLMHPRDTLDEVQADMLFRLCAITVVEMARDIRANKGIGSVRKPPKTRRSVPHNRPALIEHAPSTEEPALAK